VASIATLKSNCTPVGRIPTLGTTGIDTRRDQEMKFSEQYTRIRDLQTCRG